MSLFEGIGLKPSGSFRQGKAERYNLLRLQKADDGNNPRVRCEEGMDRR
jgi:hypothetical protein